MRFENSILHLFVKNSPPAFLQKEGLGTHYRRTPFEAIRGGNMLPKNGGLPGNLQSNGAKIEHQVTDDQLWSQLYGPSIRNLKKVAEELGVDLLHDVPFINLKGDTQARRIRIQTYYMSKIKELGKSQKDT